MQWTESNLFTKDRGGPYDGMRRGGKEWIGEGVFAKREQGFCLYGFLGVKEHCF